MNYLNRAYKFLQDKRMELTSIVSGMSLSFAMSVVVIDGVARFANVTPLEVLEKIGEANILSKIGLAAICSAPGLIVTSIGLYSKYSKPKIDKIQTSLDPYLVNNQH